MSSPGLPLKLPIGERAVYLAKLGGIAIWGACLAIRHAVLPPADSPGVARVVYAYLLRSLSMMPTRFHDARKPRPSTNEVIEKYCAKNEIDYEVDELPEGAKLYWVGPRPAPGGDVLLFFHGGGYFMPASIGHTPFAIKSAKQAGASLAMLQYTLAPIGRYPTQIRQATSALKRILNNTSASHITIAGDSAGGNLALGLLSHIKSPKSGIDEIKLEGKLKGLCLICPFLSFNYDKESYSRNGNRDMLNSVFATQANDKFRPSGVTDDNMVEDPYASPRDAPAGWWRDCPVERIFLVAGEYEVFHDDAVAFGKKLEMEAAPTGSKIDLLVAAKECHDVVIIDEALGLKEGESAKAIASWMSGQNSRG